MERAVGIGGVFMRSSDPAALARWYTEHLGVTAYSEESAGTWWQEAGPTVWSPFAADTDYFGRREQGCSRDGQCQQEGKKGDEHGLAEELDDELLF